LPCYDTTNVNETHYFAISPLPSGTLRLSYDDCLEEIGKLSELFCTLCYAQCHAHAYNERFLKMIVGLRLGLFLCVCLGLAYWVFCGPPFEKRFALCYRIVVCPSCPVCDVGVLSLNGWMDQVETWRAGRPRPTPHGVRWGPAPLPQRGTVPPQFSAQTAGWIKMPLGTKVGLGPGHIVLEGDPAPQTGAQQPIFGPRQLCLVNI